MSRLGIIDWGIGGVSIYKLVKMRMPGVAVTYFSDTGVTPYGKMGRRDLATRLDTVIEFLKGRGVTHIVIGCNAASTVIHDLRDHGVPILGMIEPAIRMTSKIRSRRLGLIGGRRTVVSGVHRRAFADRGIAVRQRIAQPLSALIESGDVSSDQLRSEVRRILEPLRNCSHILLACTHYPAVLPVLQAAVPNIRFLDPAEEVVNALGRQNIERDGGADEFLTTGDPRAMKKAASNAFGVKIVSAVKVAL
ncbi:MAG TPA: aspartate/glutamate racemase family protein [Pyrinomonadaceae bacterium]|jgi:glutamate racemase|nr:aspartate/glutamate racemase family protein [Pyrinomonadaceae bacterium]